VLLAGLERLEYRGYDSAGVAIHTETGLCVQKAKGRISVLQNVLGKSPLKGTIGIGHTRWATHGKPSDANAHPHTDNDCAISVVHNGIIENYMELKQQLIAQGATFSSETDTEVIAHLIASVYTGDLVAAVRNAVSHIRGAFALAVLAAQQPDQLVVVRMHSPLVIGIGHGEYVIASDIPAILPYTREVCVLEDGDVVVLSYDAMKLMDVQGSTIERAPLHIDWDVATAEKNGFEHFMLKEMHEQPNAYRETMRTRMHDGRIVLTELDAFVAVLPKIGRIHIVACGTAYHAGLIGQKLIERIAGIPVEVDVASEYRYREPIIDAHTWVIVVSQSGETADTLAALREAKRRGARVLAITNVVASSVAREADDVLLTMAGPEIAVASTKAYTTMVVVFQLLSLWLAQERKIVLRSECEDWWRALEQLPVHAQHVLQQAPKWHAIAQKISLHDHVFFIGRGLDYAVAQEGSLKLKEISYIHSEAYAAGELKHGTLALISEGVPVIALATQADVCEKMLSNIIEVQARGAYVIGIGAPQLRGIVDEYIDIPQTIDAFSPALSVIPLQFVAYYAACIRGNDVDKPRNLAKSVTVE
jgi:glucosamine--fructose-6-phosphate aminotransferase (isomerizing)